MVVYRLTSVRFPRCDGEGARLYGGRWNSIGRPVVYTASTQSLAALEILAHTAALANDYVAVSIVIPADLRVEQVLVADLPDWETKTTRSIGDAWLSKMTSAILQVPSRVIPAECNYVLNPKHLDFVQLTIAPTIPFKFDQRLQDRFIGLR